MYALPSPVFLEVNGNLYICCVLKPNNALLLNPNAKVDLQHTMTYNDGLNHLKIF